MKADVYSLAGKKLRKIELPGVFETELHPELIKRAVLSIQSAKKQPKGPSKRSGRDGSAEYRGLRALPTAERSINVGRARLPRTKNRRGLLYGRVAKVPQAVGGVKAHPPKPEKKIAEGINKKEKRQALQSAIAASIDAALVKARHAVDEKIELPVVVEDSIEKLKKTKEVGKTLKALHLWQDVENAKQKKRRRSGKGKQRGRKSKQKLSLLIITGQNSEVYKAARNLPGVDVCAARNLNVELLAPGAQPGRLCVWSEAAIKELAKALVK